MRDIGGAKIAAVGPATAAKLRELHLQVDLMPEEYIGAEIARAFKKHGSIENSKICLLRAEKANPELPRALEEMGAIVDDIGLYQMVAETEDFFGAAEDFQKHGADWLTFTSSSTVEFFHARFDLPKTGEKISAVENRVHRAGNEQGDHRAGLETGHRSQRTHNRWIAGGHFESGEGLSK